MSRQLTDTLFMIRPKHFGFNEETAPTNYFQRPDLNAAETIQMEACKEFDDLVKRLIENKIIVWVYEDDDQFKKPDAVFPNNWISFHDDKMVFYPLLSENRRCERRDELVDELKRRTKISDTDDLTSFEDHGLFLEGTGSLVLDRKNKIAYSGLSSRTTEKMIDIWCNEMNYEAKIFSAKNKKNETIYHTNVLISIGETLAVLASPMIPDEKERVEIISCLGETHQIISITEEQVNHFCGNILQVKNTEDKKFWIMSGQAFVSFTEEQKKILSEDSTILYSDLSTIEAIGGGSARCMLAEVFYKK